ncbi:recombinase family protein, partial [Lysinibacillus sp. VIII_CA]
LGKIAEEKIVVGYCRVSSKKQQADLKRQVQNMKTYLLAQGKPFKIVVLYKDRLVRFGYELIKNICDKN